MCGPQVSSKIRRVQNRDEGFFKTPQKPTNMDGVKMMLREAYVSKRCTKAIKEGKYKPLGGATADTSHDHLCLQATVSYVQPPMSNQMLDLIEGYLDNISAAKTQAVSNGVPLYELSASLAVLVDTVDTQAKYIKSLHQQIKAQKKKILQNRVGERMQVEA